MKRPLLLVGIFLALTTAIWVLASKPLSVPIQAKLIFTTNSAAGDRLYVVAVTNLTKKGVFISGYGERFVGGGLRFSALQGNPYIFWKDLPAQGGTWVAAKVTSPNKKQIFISYEVHSAWDDFRRRTAQWLPKRFRPSSTVIPYKQSVVIDLPPE